MKIYLVTAGYSEPDFVFDEYKLAEEFILNMIRNSYPCGFSFTIHQRTLNYTHKSYEYHYTGRIKDAGNLRFVEITFPFGKQDEPKFVNETVKEVITRYYGRESEIIDTQLSEINPSNPKYLYFNSKKILAGFSFNIKSKELIYKNNRIEEVTDEDIKEYFKYRIYLSAYDNEDGEE